jgi:hypothetical protein
MRSDTEGLLSEGSRTRRSKSVLKASETGFVWSTVMKVRSPLDIGNNRPLSPDLLVILRPATTAPSLAIRCRSSRRLAAQAGFCTAPTASGSVNWGALRDDQRVEAPVPRVPASGQALHEPETHLPGLRPSRVHGSTLARHVLACLSGHSDGHSTGHN